MTRGHKVKKKKEVIVKNASNNISHSMNRIKENEKKYTIILVAFFFILFCIIGYSSLRVHSDSALGNIHQSIWNQNELLSFGKLITLTNDNIQSDNDGLQTQGYNFTIDNHFNKVIRYRILLVYDNSVIDDCGCQNRLFPQESIRYSVDNSIVQNISSSDELVLSEGYLDKNSSKNLNIKMWINETFDSNSDSHFHGHFVVEKIK